MKNNKIELNIFEKIFNTKCLIKTGRSIFLVHKKKYKLFSSLLANKEGTSFEKLYPISSNNNPLKILIHQNLKKILK